MAISFILRSEKREKPVTIYARLRETGKSWYFATPYRVKAAQWNAKRGLPKKGNTPQEQSELETLSASLAGLEKAVLAFINKCEKKGRDYTRADIEEVVGTTSAGKNDTNKDIPRPIACYLDYLINEMAAGNFRFGAQVYDHDTIKVWKGFRQVYLNFEADFESKAGRVLEWDTIDKAVYDSFVSFCQGWGYLTKSINKYLICFKAAIRYAADYHKLHTNTSCVTYFHKLREVEGCAQSKIYLTDDEIQALFDMPLEPGSLKDQVRDIFLCGCYCGQRVSDYGRLSADNFTTTPRGTAVVRLIQEKTDNLVLVPILNDNLLRIAEKYNYNLPKVADQIINRYIKQICKELSLSVPSLAERVRTTLTLREQRIETEKPGTYERDEAGNVVKPRYDLVCTHTARRSLITNLYKSRLFSTLQIMSISGHKTENTFFVYISESAAEIADEIAEIQRRRAEQGKASNEELF